MKTEEVECRFLEINKEEIIKKLIVLGAEDLGEKMVEETIIYGPDSATWKGRFIRIRSIGDKTKLAYKEHRNTGIDGTFEIEFDIGDYKKAELFFEKIGFVSSRHQQKKRHTFKLGNITFDIDTWPRIPPLLEIEAESRDELGKISERLGLNWNDARFENAGWIIENVYKIPVLSMKWFTFDRFE